MAVTWWSFPDGSDGDPLTPALVSASRLLTPGLGHITTTDTYIVPNAVAVPASPGGAVGWPLSSAFTSQASFSFYFKLYNLPAAGKVTVLLDVRRKSVENRTVEVDSAGVLRGGALQRGGSVPVGEWLRLSLQYNSAGFGLIIELFLGNETTPLIQLLEALPGGAQTPGADMGIGVAGSGAGRPAGRIGPWAYDNTTANPIAPFVPARDEIVPGVRSAFAGTVPVGKVLAGTTQLWP